MLGIPMKQKSSFSCIRHVRVSALIVALCALAAGAKSQKMVMHFFGSPTCGECLEIKETLLKPLANEHADKIELRIYDIESDTGLTNAIQFEKMYGVKKTLAQELFFADTFLTGFADIMRVGKPLLLDRMNNPTTWDAVTGNPGARAPKNVEKKDALRQRMSQFTFLAITLAGIADGINPCAIATMIFLISFLTVQKRKRIEILVVGMSFTFSVFVTYLLLGVGAFEALTFLQKYLWISKAIKWSAVVFAGVVALYCFYDAIIFSRTKNVKEMKNQLSPAIKKRIHKVISGNLTSRSLVLGSLVTGFLVTLLEAVCTGQVYLPTIILMTREHGLKLQGWLYLLFYNFLFVLPLLLVMIGAYFGLTWERLSKVTQKHLTTLKIVLGIVLTALALYLALSQ